MTPYYADIKISKSKSGHIFWIGWLFVFVFVVTPYNHRTYYNELLKSGRQVKDSFYAYVGEGGASNSDDLKVAGLVPRLFLATSDDSSFCLLWGKFCFSWVTPLQVLYVVFILFGGVKDFCRCLHLGWFPGDRCRARTLDPCVSPLCYDSENASFRGVAP